MRMVMGMIVMRMVGGDEDGDGNDSDENGGW